jgi:hypothetical protein
VCLMIYRRLNAGLPPIRMSRRSQVADNKERCPKKEESAGKVAASAGTIASGYASAVKYFGAEPSSPAVLEAGQL